MRDDAPRGAVEQLAIALRGATTADEQQLLAWVAERVPHRTIAAWLGISYDAATKRVSRLCHRLRATATRHVASLSDADTRRELDRFMQRAGSLPPLAIPASRSRVTEGVPETASSFMYGSGRRAARPHEDSDE